MSDFSASILVPIDTAAGASAINYSARQGECPILALHCKRAVGSGTVKITPLRSAGLALGATVGEGGRLRIATDANGAITTVEIAAGGTGYPDGPIPVTVNDPYGSGGEISCTASGGVLSAVSVVSPGSRYSGYIEYEIEDFVEGVTYNFIPRWIEQTGGTGSVSLLGEKLSFRPFQVF
jgi:hypothetical protein